MDAANMLKPALARGSLHCIGATTFPEYEAHIARDGAIARRLQPVIVDEPSAPETLVILGGLQGRYEAFHRVRFAPPAMRAAVAFAAQHGAERRRPDSAIDLLDEAAALAHMQQRRGPVATAAAGGGTRSESGKGDPEAARRSPEQAADGAAPQGVSQATLDTWLQERWQAGAPVSEAHHRRLMQWCATVSRRLQALRAHFRDRAPRVILTAADTVC